MTKTKKKRKYTKTKKSETKKHEKIYIHIKKDTIQMFLKGILNLALNSGITFLIYCMFMYISSIGDVTLTGIEITGGFLIFVLLCSIIVFQFIPYLKSMLAIFGCMNRNVKNKLNNEIIFRW